MSMIDMTLAQLADGLRQGEMSSVEITRAYLERIGRMEEKVGAYITLTPETALAQA